MASDRQVELRLSRLENDRDSVYELLSGIQSTLEDHTRRFDGIDQRFDGIDQRFDGIDRRLDGMDARFDGIDTTLAEVLRRLPGPA